MSRFTAQLYVRRFDVYCRRCQTTREVPPALTAKQRTKILERWRQPGRGLDAVTLLVAQTGVSTWQAKAIMVHLARRGPTCHRCRAVLAADPVTECATCKSVVLNW